MSATLRLDLLVLGELWVALDIRKLKFLLLSESQYLLCDANGALDLSSLTTCESGGVCQASTITGSSPCSSGSPDCDLPAISTVSPETPSSTIQSTTDFSSTTNSQTTSSPFNATVYCANKAVGRYEFESSSNKYVYCYANGGILGAVYSCVGKTLFNPLTQLCEVNYDCKENCFWKVRSSLDLKFYCDSSDLIVRIFCCRWTSKNSSNCWTIKGNKKISGDNTISFQATHLLLVSM